MILKLEIAKRAIELANDDYSDDIVTTVEPLGEVFIAEDYHHNYFAENKETPYCNAVIAPKIAKLKEVLWTNLELQVSQFHYRTYL